MAESSNTTASMRDPNIFYESTPDGDIRIIDQSNNKTGNNNSAGDGGNELFQHNLRQSWDDEYEDLEIDTKLGSGGDGGTKSSASQQQKQKQHQNRHKHNLSVQFFDISISDDKVKDEGASDKKEQPSVAAATTPMDTTTVPAPPTVTADTTPSPQHSRTKSSIEVEAAAAYYFESNDDSPEKERAKNDDIANFQKNVHSSWESGDEEEDDSVGGKQQSAFSTKPTPSKPPRHHHNLSVQFTDSFVVNDGSKEQTGPQKEKQQQRPPPQPQAPTAGIVVPVPIVVRPSANRKHRRVYSGRSNPAMAHRRVNTRGDSAPTKGEVWAPTPPASMPPPHSSLPPPHNPAHPHPATGYPYHHPPPYYHQATPPPPPQPYAPVPTPPPPYRAAPTPPPPYDPYYAATQPVDPRYYAAPSPHHNQSPVSDAGVNYDARASPMIHQSPGVGGQCPSSVQSSPGGYYADQSPHPPPHSTNLFTRPPNHLSQPPLGQEEDQQREKDCQTEKKAASSDLSKENDDDGGNAASPHHRVQSSLGDFLVNSGFEDLFEEDGGYDSAPDEQQSKRHNKTLSSASFLRSLSSDNFLKDHLPLVEEERHSGDNSPYPSPQVNSAPNTPHGGAYHQPPYPGYFQGPPPPASSWQQHPSNYPQHSPIQPSTQQRQLFGGGTIQTQFASPSPRNQQCLPASPPSSAPQDSHQKRQRRKCSVPDCPNRVVQGGLCIGHGAKRKTCSHPGCTKNVKAKGLCSTHGPARKRCAAEGCTKVAVQGGRCIAHGAKKKVCTFPQCTKQAILGGMCKKHHDETHGIVKARGQRKPKNESPTSSAISGSGKPGHERGLSLFTDSAIVDSIISNANAAEQEH